MPFSHHGQWIKIGKLPSELARKWGLDSRKAYEFFFDGNRIKLRNSQGEIVTDKPSTAEEVLSLVILGRRDPKKIRAEEEAIPGTSYLYQTRKGVDGHHVIPKSLHNHAFIKAVEDAAIRAFKDAARGKININSSDEDAANSSDEDAAIGKININSSENFIFLPSDNDEANKLLQESGYRLPCHDGYHNRYTKIVRERLDEEWRRLENYQLTRDNEVVLQRYCELINKLKYIISNPPANVNRMDDFTEEHFRF